MYIYPCFYIDINLLYRGGKIYNKLIAKLSGKYNSFPCFFGSYEKTKGVHSLKLCRDIQDNPRMKLKKFQKMYTFHYLFMRG